METSLLYHQSKLLIEIINITVEEELYPHSRHSSGTVYLKQKTNSKTLIPSLKRNVTISSQNCLHCIINSSCHIWILPGFGIFLARTGVTKGIEGELKWSGIWILSKSLDFVQLETHRETCRIWKAPSRITPLSLGRLGSSALVSACGLVLAVYSQSLGFVYKKIVAVFLLVTLGEFIGNMVFALLPDKMVIILLTDFSEVNSCD